MPTYSYICNGRHGFEVTCSFDDYQSVVDCPHCSKPAIRHYPGQRVYTIDSPTGSGKGIFRFKQEKG